MKCSCGLVTVFLNYIHTNCFYHQHVESGQFVFCTFMFWREAAKTCGNLED